MFDYMVSKERSSWAVWSCAPYTGDKRELLSWHMTKDQALRAIDKRRAADAAKGDSQ